MPFGTPPEGPSVSPPGYRVPKSRRGIGSTPIKKLKKRQQHPEAKDSPLLEEDDLERQIGLKICADVQFAQFDRTQWENRTAKWFRQRFGLRDEKTFPWPKASNIHLPLTDSQCRNFMAKLHRLVFGSVPLVSAEGQGPEDQKEVNDAELFMDWLCRFRMRDFQKQVTIGNSKIAEQGFGVFKVIWEHRTRVVREVMNLQHDLPDQLQHVVLMLRNQVPEGMQIPPDFIQGIASVGGPEDYAKKMLIEEYEFDEEGQDKAKIERIIKQLKDPTIEEIKFDYLETIYDAPRLMAIEPKDFVVPGDTTDLQSARVACHRMYMPIEELEERERVGLYKNVSKILPRTGDSLSPVRSGTRLYSYDDFEALTIEKKSKEGVQNSPTHSSFREIWEVHFWHRPEPDDKLQRWVMTIDRQTKTVLRFVPLPYDHGRLPFIQVAREIVDPRFHSSRGIPEMVEGMQTELNVTLNQQVDRETLINAPWYTYIGNSGFSPRSLRFIPGQGVPVRTHDDIKFPVIVDANKGVWETRRQELKAWAEQYVGAQDFGLRSQTNQGGDKGGGRTATEIQQIGQLSDLLFGMDAAVYSDQFKEIFEQIWALWMQYGDDEVWIRVMNKPPRKMTKREIVGNFDFRFTGKADTSNPLLQAQKAQFRLQALLPFSDQPLPATDNKTFMIRKADLIEDYLQKDDPRAALRVLHELTPEELQMMQQQQQEAQQQQMMQGLAMEGAKKGLDMTSAVQPPGPQGGMNGRPVPGPMAQG